jgi:hypothetical protein
VIGGRLPLYFIYPGRCPGLSYIAPSGLAEFKKQHWGSGVEVNWGGVFLGFEAISGFEPISGCVVLLGCEPISGFEVLLGFEVISEFE